MQLIDPNHAFYRPLRTRVIIVALCAAWFVLEVMAGASFWLVIVGALTAYTAWALLIRFPKSAEAEGQGAQATADESKDP